MNSPEFTQGLIITNVTTLISTIMLFRALREERRQHKKLYEVARYLLGVADEQGLELKEFDLIAINTLIQEK